MDSSVAIVGMACVYADAKSPKELWENVLSRRRAFRRIPTERLNLEDYFSVDRSAPDSIYISQAAVIEGYEFDRIRFRVAGSTYRSTDTTHWLALDVAARALEDAGFPEGDGLPREMTGVLLGNTLTGEFSRANVMRLRWPYVRRVVEAELVKEGRSPEAVHEFLNNLEIQYKSPFPDVNEETLAGGMSNTIAGRICNYFNLNGGGYALDGACASSLLAAANACSSLIAGDIDVALAGGVDLSLDPFELVGFAKTGALASDEMRVFDVRSSGFWPGEGCGFLVLMRYEEAIEQQRHIYAQIKGWGVSSDGNGGITRPEVSGQLLAFKRAYKKAGFGADSVGYFEGHGTGTEVGDAAELRTLSQARITANQPDSKSAYVGSLKANIGHTKAAAGVAGLIKAAMAINSQVIPPNTGTEQPHPELTDTLRVDSEGTRWPESLPLRAGVSAMGFGGINTHIVLEGCGPRRRDALSAGEQWLLASSQDAELFLLGAETSTGLSGKVEHLISVAPRLSYAEMADLAAQLSKTVEANDFRAAIVASSPEELAQKLETLSSWLNSGKDTCLDVAAGIFLGSGDAVPRIGFLFPGQGSPVDPSGGAFRRRFEFLSDLYPQRDHKKVPDSISTKVMQPAIVTSSIAAVRMLDELNINGTVGVGHSLGEITALFWAGAIDAETLLRIVTVRGKAMAERGSPDGAMASIEAGSASIENLINGDAAVVSAKNSPRQTIVSGEKSAIDEIIIRARTADLKAMRLPVSHAFHSPLVADAVPVFKGHLENETFHNLSRKVFSTVTGTHILEGQDLSDLLVKQVTYPVQFIDAISAADLEVDLWIEAGPGRVLSGLVSEFNSTPALTVDAGGKSLKPLLSVVGAAFVLGSPVNRDALFADRFTRHFDLDWQPKFFENPCEQAPVSEFKSHSYDDTKHLEVQSLQENIENPIGDRVTHGEPSPLQLLRQLVSEWTELPPSAIKDSSHMLTDLHMNSISVGEIVAECARRLHLQPPASPTDYADATIENIARSLEERAGIGDTPSREAEHDPAGVDSWLRAFNVELVECPLSGRQTSVEKGTWQIVSSPHHPLKNAISETFGRLGTGGGVVVCVPTRPDETCISVLLDGAKTAMSARDVKSVVFVQSGGGAAAFAKTLFLEAPWLTVVVVDVPFYHPGAVDWIAAEASNTAGFVEAHYDSLGTRFEPRLRLLQLETETGMVTLDASDVLLVTGGGKGIACECALNLAKDTGVRVALLGRSEPSSDADLALNLRRMEDSGVEYVYVSADATEANAVKRAVEEIEAKLGTVTGVLHGAGSNTPRLISELDEEKFLETLAPKVLGAQNIIDAVDVNSLRLFIVFGSVIARTGMRGEADYAVANEWLTSLLESFQTQHPACRCISVEWSVWSGVGMGERLGRLDALTQQGIAPISPDDGMSMLRLLIGQQLPGVPVIVTGRFGKTPTLKTDEPELLLLRFLERPRVNYRGVELVVDTKLSTQTDLYLNDHVFQGEKILPATIGLEAVAQAAMALVESEKPPEFSNVKFLRPIVVTDESPVTLRMAALVVEPNLVKVAARSSSTNFQTDHFTAICDFRNSGYTLDKSVTVLKHKVSSQNPLPIDPKQDLYGGILFHEGRFQRLEGYHLLSAKECVAEISSGSARDWFVQYLPDRFVLGDPAARDAAIHAIQACIPQATLLPTGVDRILSDWSNETGPLFVYARERLRDGSEFTYDVEIANANGDVQERWEGLRLHLMSGSEFRGNWPAPLLGPYFERVLSDMAPDSKAAICVDLSTEGDNKDRSHHGIQRLVGRNVSVQRRPDGKPEIHGESSHDISLSHAGNVTLAVLGTAPVGCDVERVKNRARAAWEGLLGSDMLSLAEYAAQAVGEGIDSSATRIWSALECMKKSGTSPVSASLILSSSTDDGWITFKSGSRIISTYLAQVRGAEDELVFAVLVGENDAGI